MDSYSTGVFDWTHAWQPLHLFFASGFVGVLFLFWSKLKQTDNAVRWPNLRSRFTSESNKASTAVRALPASWYRSEPMYDLERRAIFSKQWLVVTHKTRFVNDGDFLQVTEAGFNFFLIRDRKGEIQGFHNICRHRAYPLVEQDCGNKKIIACKYHGTSSCTWALRHN